MSIFRLDKEYDGPGSNAPIDGHTFLTGNGANAKLHFESIQANGTPDSEVTALVRPIAGGDIDGNSFFSVGDQFEISYDGGLTWVVEVVEYIYDPNGNSDSELMLFQSDSDGEWYAYNLGVPGDTTGDAEKQAGGPIAQGHQNNGSLVVGTTPYCFASGTLIETPSGAVAVESLIRGDEVTTLHNGSQKIRWIGRTVVELSRRSGHIRPIRIKAGSLGEKLPTQDLLVSPAHRMLISGWNVELLFAERQVLIAAKSLVNDSTITVAHDLVEVEYYHVMFDKHEIVISNGSPSESFFASSAVIDAMDLETRRELLELFPELDSANQGIFGQTVCPTLTHAEALLLF